ncbi:MAG: tetratricopeptide repeat protein [Candidatus Limnocylindria bacterium]
MSLGVVPLNSAAPRTTSVLIGGLLVAAVALLAAAGYLLFAQPPGGAPSAVSASASVTPSAGSNPAGIADPDERVAFWEARVAANPVDYASALNLADAYLDRSRLRGDLEDLTRAQAATDAAREHAPAGRQVDIRDARIAFALHEFRRARTIAEQLLASDAEDPVALSVAADSALELGDDAAAEDLYTRLAAQPQGPATWSRLGRLSLLHGDVDEAIRLISHAADAAGSEGFPDATAFYSLQLAELYRGQGELEKADQAYNAALDAYPRYPPALAGLGRLREAQGRRADAIQLLEDATAALPLPEFVAALGDLYALDGNEREAERRYALVERIGELARRTGAVYDRQLVVFFADHDRKLSDAVTLAQREIEVRTDVYGYDALAWAQFKAGHIAEASEAADRALRLGTLDARIRYHAGLIAAAQGNTDTARELLGQAVAREAALPPLQVSRARDALAELDGE